MKPQQFKRLGGVPPETDEEIVLIVHTAQAEKQPGRPSKFSLEDQVLITLEYLREYRTYFQSARSWGMNALHIG